MKLHHRILGEGQPLVILHGLFGYSDNWQTHAKKLAEYYQIILVDQRNHGHSPWSDSFNYDLLAEDLKELFDDLKLEKAILLGHSMGGKTAMRFAQLYPNFLEKLIVVDMGPKKYPPHHEQILAGLHAIDFSVIQTRSKAEETMSEHISSYGVRQFLLKNLYWKEKGKLAWRMNIPVLEKEMHSILDGLPEMEVHIPTLFIRGKLSDYVLDEDFSDIENSFPDSQFVTIENAGHWVHSEAPDEFIEAVLSFCLR
jgi:esterase